MQNSNNDNTNERGRVVSVDTSSSNMRYPNSIQGHVVQPAQPQLQPAQPQLHVPHQPQPQPVMMQTPSYPMPTGVVVGAMNTPAYPMVQNPSYPGVQMVPMYPAAHVPSYPAPLNATPTPVMPAMISTDGRTTAVINGQPVIVVQASQHRMQVHCPM